MQNTFEIPILIITFNRPTHTRRVWEEVKKQRPKYVYVFQDGARDGNDADMEKCEAVRAIFSEERDWDCELKTNYSNINLGCGRGPVSGISWFFEQVEQGIIMEDDCLPHPDFFGYCEELLNKYKNEPRVMVVGTTTYHNDYPCDDSYLFSRYFTGGAWAGWRRAWNGFSVDLETVDVNVLKKTIRKAFYSTAETNWWVRKVKEIKADTAKKGYWDYQMQIHMLLNNGLATRPQRNMICNIGFDPEGTHTLVNDSRGERTVFPCFPLQHPATIKVNGKNDYLFMAKELQQRLDKRIISALYRYMNENEGGLHRLLQYYKKQKRAWLKG
ncbi:MAG: hypothetical protein QM751_12700 [Paludibacteraceae bacterium]